MSKFRQKLKSIGYGKTTEFLKSVSAISKLKGDSLNTINTKKPKEEKVKKQPCYLYLGRLISHPKILLTQNRFESFDTLEQCEEWCKTLFSEYEIKDDRTSKTILKFKQNAEQ